jgi:hypothetical protein
MESESFGPKALLQFGVIDPEFRTQVQGQCDIRCVVWIHILGKAAGTTHTEIAPERSAPVMWDAQRNFMKLRFPTMM